MARRWRARKCSRSVVGFERGARYVSSRYAQSIHHRAATLVELLAMITIVVVLASLLWPAILSARATAARVTCQANLAQWGQATSAYIAVWNQLPPAASWREGERRDRVPIPPRHSVFAFLLPYVDQSNVSVAIRWDRDWNDPLNEPATKQDLGGIFICPAAPGGREAKHPTDYSLAVSVDPSDRSGLGRLLHEGRIQNRTSIGPPTWGVGATAWNGALQLDQIDYERHFVDRRIVRPRDLRDGLSRTGLLFENGGKPWCYRDGARSDCHITRFRWANPAVWMTINDFCHTEQLMNCHNNSQPYSFHAGGIFGVSVDGSVRFWAEDGAADRWIAWITAAASD